MLKGEKKSVKYNFRTIYSFMSFVFLHTVPSDPLVPTAVLGEALILYLIFFFLHDPTSLHGL